MSALAWDPLVWLALAMLLMAGEAVLPGYVLLGFGIGAGLVAATVAVLADRLMEVPQPISALVTIWAGASLTAWLLVWLVLGRRTDRHGGDDVNDFTNRG